MGVRLGAILTDANARLGDGKQGRAAGGSKDALVDLVLLERTLLDPPRQAAMVRWVQQIPLDPRHHSKVQYSLLREQLLAKKPPC